MYAFITKATCSGTVSYYFLLLISLFFCIYTFKWQLQLIAQQPLQTNKLQPWQEEFIRPLAPHL